MSDATNSTVLALRAQSDEIEALLQGWHVRHTNENVDGPWEASRCKTFINASSFAVLAASICDINVRRHRKSGLDKNTSARLLLLMHSNVIEEAFKDWDISRSAKKGTWGGFLHIGDCPSMSGPTKFVVALAACSGVKEDLKDGVEA